MRFQNPEILKSSPSNIIVSRTHEIHGFHNHRILRLYDKDSLKSYNPKIQRC
ncbi:hypothetical protein ACVW1L_000002 [Ewingella americana]